MPQPSNTTLEEVIAQAVEWEHSPVGPSAGTRWFECPGSVLATMGMDDVSSDYAIEGTAGHTVTEWCREKGHRAEHYLGVMVPVWVNATRTDMIECDQEMVDAVNVFLDYTEEFHGDIFVEEKVSYERWVPGGFGTSDDMRVTEKLCVVTDFKYGKGIQVYAEENIQLKLYALGFWHDFGWMYPDIEEFQLNICQPRLQHKDEFTVSKEDLLKWADEEVRPHGEAALTPGADFKAGGWCQFCLINETCRCRDETMFSQVVDDFEEVREDTEIMDATEVTLEELALRLPLIKAIKQFCSDLEERAVSELGKGNKVTHPTYGDYKMVAGRGGRKWKQSEEDTMHALRTQYKMRVKDITKQTLLTPPAIEKVVGKKSPIMTELVEKVAGKPTLARGDDKRESLKIDAAEEFSSEDSAED